MSYYICKGKIQILPDEIEDCGTITQNETQVCTRCELESLRKENKLLRSELEKERVVVDHFSHKRFMDHAARQRIAERKEV